MTEHRGSEPGQVPFKPEQAQLAVAVETEQATAADGTANWRLFGFVQEATSLPDPSIEWVEERIIGGTREIFNKVDGQRTYDGGSIPVTPIDGFPIAILLGQDTVETLNEGTEDEIYKHTLTALTDDIPPTQTIEAAFDAPQSGSDPFVRRFLGAAPQSGEIAVNNEAELEVSLDYIAMGVNPNPTETNYGSAEIPDRDPWLFHDATSNLELFGTSFARVNDFNLGISNNLEDGRYIHEDGAEDPYELTYGMTEYDLSATITVADDLIYQELLDTSETFEASLEFTKPSGDVLRITCHDVDMQDAPHDIPAEETTVDVDVSMIPESITIEVEDTVTADPYV